MDDLISGVKGLIIPRSQGEINKKVLEANGITTLYHFTARPNWDKIKGTGLLSQRRLIEKNIAPMYASSENSRTMDAGLNLDDYVRLSFTRNHPMMWIAKNEVPPGTEFLVIPISLDVILLEGVRFSDVNAVRTKTPPYAQIKDTPNHLRFDVLRQPKQFNLPAEVKPYYQAEVLVPRQVPYEYFGKDIEIKKI